MDGWGREERKRCSIILSMQLGEIRKVCNLKMLNALAFFNIMGTLSWNDCQSGVSRKPLGLLVELFLSSHTCRHLDKRSGHSQTYCCAVLLIFHFLATSERSFPLNIITILISEERTQVKKTEKAILL